MDDEIQVQDIACHMLEYLGYQVEVVADGREAIERYQEKKKEGKPFDVVIMDLTVPGGMGGAEAAQKILAEDPHAPLLVSSGYSNDPIMSNCTAHGFKGAVIKPYQIQELQDAIDIVIAP